MARPRKTAMENRTEQVNVRLTTAERIRFEEAAERSGLNLSDFLRACATMKPVSVKPQRSLKAEAITALLRLGVNLNQITKRLNMGTANTLDMSELTELLGLIRAELNELER